MIKADTLFTILLIALAISIGGNIFQYFTKPKCDEAIKTITKTDTVTIQSEKHADFHFSPPSHNRNSGTTNRYNNSNFTADSKNDTKSEVIHDPIILQDSTKEYMGSSVDSSGIGVSYKHLIKGELLDSKISVVCPQTTKIITNTVTKTVLRDRGIYLGGSMEFKDKKIYDIKPAIYFQYKSSIFGYQYGIKQNTHGVTIGVRL